MGSSLVLPQLWGEQESLTTEEAHNCFTGCGSAAGVNDRSLLLPPADLADGVFACVRSVLF